MNISATITSDDCLSEESVNLFKENGFLRIPELISRDKAARFAEIVGSRVREESAKGLKTDEVKIFDQYVNLWTIDDEVKGLSMHPRLVKFIKQLAGVPLRYWHDHALIKYPGRNAPTEFHQDEPYWPHEGSRFGCAAWIALVDVPVARGCMSYIPGYQHRTDLGRTDLDDKKGLFGECPELEWEPMVSVPLRAGDCTVHHCRCPHGAGANITDEARVALISMFMDAEVKYTGTGHAVADNNGLTVGEEFDHELFPVL